MEEELNNLGYNGPTLRHRNAGDRFFQDGNTLWHQTAKHCIYDLEESELLHNVVPEFQCQVYGCSSTFDSVASHEQHYQAKHRNLCATCRQTFPTMHILDLHILETHDSFFQLLAEKKNMYKCIVESCTETFRNAQDRKEHMITLHKFPANFKFGLQQVRNKAKKDERAKHKNLKKTEAKDADMTIDDESTSASVDAVDMETEKVALTKSERKNRSAKQRKMKQKAQAAEDGMDFDLASGDPTLAKSEPETLQQSPSNRVPKTIMFGKGPVRGFKFGSSSSGRGKHWHQQFDSSESTAQKNTMEVEELKEALMEI